jgi:hypothetical protein
VLRDWLCETNLFLFTQALALSRTRITEKSAEAAKRPCITELEEANVQLRAELAAANAKIAEVKNNKRALISDYGSLSSDYGDLASVFTVLQKEKDDLEKVECEKAQRFHQVICTKLHGLHRDLEKSIDDLGGQYFEFPNSVVTVGNIMD